jgi:hypothetical protein
VRHPKRAQPTTEDVAKEILGYFLHHPGAADSVEGIAQWRLQAERIERTVRETQDAVRWLVDNGYLEEVRTASEPVFMLKRDRG